VALCRCGFSKRKPLCDNAHRAGGFHEPGAVHDEDSVQDPGTEGSTLRVIPHENASLELSGPFALGGADGSTLLAGTSTWLCRCGHSRSKPFCDGSHERVGFKSG
jgi:CDGSH-type Zn-finger protein